MKNFARVWVDPTFQFTSLIFLLVFHFSIVVGTVVYIGLETTTENLEPKFWAIGSAIAFFVLCFMFIGFIWFANKKWVYFQLNLYGVLFVVFL